MRRARERRRRTPPREGEHDAFSEKVTHDPSAPAPRATRTESCVPWLLPRQQEDSVTLTYAMRSTNLTAA